MSESLMISVCMIVKNEEEILEKCLKSLKGFDEIVILDTGSTDKTGEIARKYTNKYFAGEYVWKDDFADARNYAKAKCTGDWIFSIDADQWVEVGTGLKAQEIVRNEKGTKALQVKVVSAGGQSRHVEPKLFRNDKDIFWKGAIHNYLNVQGKKTVDLTVFYGYSPAHKLDPNRALRILKKEVQKNPDAVRELFYLGREYMYRKEWIKAVYWFEQYVKKGFWAPELAEVYLQLATAYWNLCRGEDARDTCLQAIKINADFQEALEFMATLSGPKNKERWLLFSQSATSENVLFNRAPVEKKESYYNDLYSKNSDMNRYFEIYKKVGAWSTERGILDIACGTAQLQFFVDHYHGFDFSKVAVKIANNPKVWTGDAYKPENYEPFDYDTYVALEVFEHLDDFKVLENIPNGKEIIFSVPSFSDPSHIRVFTEKIMRTRYAKWIKIEQVVQFNWDGKWVEGGKETNSYILLIRGKACRL